MIKLDQSNAHLKSTELGVCDHVSQGEVTKFVGATGKVLFTQLHFWCQR